MRNATLTVVALTIWLLAHAPDYAHAQTRHFNIQKPVAALDEQPRFPGCDIPGATDREQLQCSEDKLKRYIEENLKYPESAKEPDFIPRVVWITVTIEFNGRIHSPKIVQPGIKEYDENAQNVFVQMVRSDLRWSPGIVYGKATRLTDVRIAVHYTWEGRSKAFPADSYSDDIYKMVDQVPSLGSCRQKGKKDEEILDCVSRNVSEFLSANLEYPRYALDAGMEGDVEVEYVVGKDGMVHNVRIINDIGIGHSGEIDRLFDLMNEKKLGWQPGLENGEPVNVLMKTVVPFTIKDKPKPLVKKAQMDPKPLFITGKAGFEEFLTTYLRRPESKDISPCAFGVIDVKFRINRHTGETDITEMIDYNKLGSKFQAVAVQFLEATNGLWDTDYPNLGDKTEYSLHIPFPSFSVACENVPLGYKQVLYEAQEAASMTDSESTFDKGMELLDKAVRLYPTDNQIRLLRGMALYKNGHRIEGCVDLKFVNKQNGDIEVPKSCKN